MEHVVVADALEWLGGLDSDCANVVVLDPPYSMSPNARGGVDDGAAGSSGAPVRLLTECLDETRRILKPGGIAPLLVDWRRLPDVSYLATRAGLRISTCVAWVRTRAGLGGLFRGAWDPILILSSGTPASRDRSAVRNVIECNRPFDKAHPYEKPVALWAPIFSRVPVGGHAVDPFVGVGASLVAAKMAGMSVSGCDINPDFVALTVDRLATLGGEGGE